MGDTREVSNGLHLIYLGNVVAIIAALCMLLAILVPLLAVLIIFAVLIGGIISLVGLARLRDLHGDYMIALIATIAGIVCSLLANKETFFGSFMNLAQSVCSLLQLYFVVRGTNSFLTERGFYSQAAMGDRAWKWQVISIVINVAAFLLIITVILLPLGFILTLANLVVSIIALVFYLTYLKASVEALR
ncbi:hypothetical protein D1646_15340 [Pseudoflavonifractor sp. 60]|uniref:hypothetical protein n=1 Tax=Pseudoflavonifractor sp. 60 TaxID=2304576 RepID=UPI00136CF031|nr:hypothetical protein [Pseudoflavonifractor sp. 60]NBI68153.1 hypothetical protein [Pseudoflavonifractor sp. 60]